jgi:hypothetical protein
LIRFFIYWSKKFFGEDFLTLRVNVHHYDVARDKSVIAYWSEVTGVPVSDFTKSVFCISKLSKKKRNTLD